MKKDDFIKIRISKKDKETLLKLSHKENENLSSFILRKSLCPDTVYPYISPQHIQMRNFINEIYHEISKSDNEKLKREVTAICNIFLLNQKLGGK